MKKTNNWKKLITLTGVAYFSLAAAFSPVATVVVQAREAATATPYAPVIEWRFKEENGKLYRRLYNYSTASWIGEWEYVCDL